MYRVLKTDYVPVPADLVLTVENAEELRRLQPKFGSELPEIEERDDGIYTKCGVVLAFRMEETPVTDSEKYRRLLTVVHDAVQTFERWSDEVHTPRYATEEEREAFSQAREQAFRRAADHLRIETQKALGRSVFGREHPNRAS